MAMVAASRKNKKSRGNLIFHFLCSYCLLSKPWTTKCFPCMYFRVWITLSVVDDGIKREWWEVSELLKTVVKAVADVQKWPQTLEWQQGSCNEMSKRFFFLNLVIRTDCSLVIGLEKLHCLLSLHWFCLRVSSTSQHLCFISISSLKIVANTLYVAKRSFLPKRAIVHLPSD